MQTEEVNMIESTASCCKLEKSSATKCPSSQNSRANLVLTENRISFDAKLGVFIVKNTEGKHHAVTLFPKQTCTCPSTGECYHIISARMSLGMQPKQTETVVNLLQLRRNTRSRKEKKSGRKRFAPTDINPAPDSIAAKSSFSLTNEDSTEMVKPEFVDVDDFSNALSNDVSDIDCSDTEMLRLWEDMSVKYKDDYTEDRDYEYIEKNDEEILMFVNMAVLIWTQY